MTTRGRQLFDQYVSDSLNHPSFASLGMGSHVFSLSETARARKVALIELVEEVGPLLPALTAARK